MLLVGAHDDSDAGEGGFDRTTVLLLEWAEGLDAIGERMVPVLNSVSALMRCSSLSGPVSEGQPGQLMIPTRSSGSSAGYSLNVPRRFRRSARQLTEEQPRSCVAFEQVNMPMSAMSHLVALILGQEKHRPTVSRASCSHASRCCSVLMTITPSVLQSTCLTPHSPKMQSFHIRSSGSPNTPCSRWASVFDMLKIKADFACRGPTGIPSPLSPSYNS
jgi:hypothetical protein